MDATFSHKFRMGCIDLTQKSLQQIYPEKYNFARVYGRMDSQNSRQKQSPILHPQAEK